MTFYVIKSQAICNLKPPALRGQVFGIGVMAVAGDEVAVRGAGAGAVDRLDNCGHNQIVGGV